MPQTPLTEAALGPYLRRKGLLGPGEEIVATLAGDGNINWVRRVRRLDGTRSWIIKQARPALERFPQYQAPTERILFEARYYEKTRELPGGEICPRVVAFDEAERVLVLEDVGDVPRLDQALARGEEQGEAFTSIARFLGAVHAATRDPGLADEFQNDGMRRLHGEHIFALPFRPNDFPLPSAVRTRAAEIQGDAELVAIADAAYRRYLEPRGALVHADVQAGNVLLTPQGPRLLDAEISHVGDPAFDVGTMLAHLLLPALAAGGIAPALSVARAMWAAYTQTHAAAGVPRFADAARYAGIEMMRRTIGAARVPVVENPSAALAVIDFARCLMQKPPERPEDLIQ